MNTPPLCEIHARIDESEMLLRAAARLIAPRTPPVTFKWLAAALGGFVYLLLPLHGACCTLSFL